MNFDLIGQIDPQLKVRPLKFVSVKLLNSIDVKLACSATRMFDSVNVAANHRRPSEVVNE